MVLVTEGVAGGGVLHAHGGGDVAGVHHVDVLPVIGVHLQDPAQALPGMLGGVEHRGALGQGAGVDPEEAQLTHKGVRGNLKGQSGEGRVVRSGTEVLLVGVGVDALDALFVQGGGHIVHHGVQHLLDALILVRGAAGDGNHGVIDGGLPDGGLDFVDGDFFAAQILLHDLIVHLGHGVHQLLVIFIGQLCHVGGDLLFPHILTQLVVEHEGLHLHQVDDALEVGLRADGELNGNGIAFQAVAHHVQHTVEVRAHDVHLVDVHHAGDLVLVGLAPHGFGLGLHAALGAQDRDGTVQHAQRAFHFQQVVAAEVMVMPRSCSWAIQSIVAEPSWVSPIL